MMKPIIKVDDASSSFYVLLIWSIPRKVRNITIINSTLTSTIETLMPIVYLS